MSWNVYFRDRAGQPSALPAGLHVAPRAYRWAAVGGPETAEMEATGPALALWRLLGWLRYGVEIRNPLEQPVWWGYVEEVAIQTGAVQVGVSLASMHNRIAVIYSYVAPGSQTVGTRATTAWAQDDDSVGEYGVKELLASVDGATPAQADNTRDILLRQHRFPIPVVERSGDDRLQARLLCRGWWETLRWRYYANAATNSVETTAQIAAMVSGVGQFFSGVDLQIASGIHTSEYRDGDSTALDIIAGLLRAGTTGGQRLLAAVTPERIVRVYEEPDPDVITLYLDSAGRIIDRLGQPLAIGQIPAGRWVGLHEVIGATAPTAYLAAASPFFAEAGEFEVERARLRLEPRGLPSPWEITRVGEG